LERSTLQVSFKINFITVSFYHLPTDSSRKCLQNVVFRFKDAVGSKDIQLYDINFWTFDQTSS